MSIEKFKLRSGAELQVDEAPFEVSAPLMEVVKKVMREMSEGKDPEKIRQIEVGDAVASDPRVRKAVMDAGTWVLYEGIQVSPALFNDAKIGKKARGDYFQIMRYIIEVNTTPFFQETSSGSTPPGEVATSGQA